MTKQRADIVICMPSLDGKYFPNMWRSLNGLIAQTTGKGHTIAISQPQTSILAISRNMGVDKALACDAKWLLYIDSDMFVPEDGLLKLMARDVDIVSGLYHSKQFPYWPIASMFNPIQPMFPPDTNPSPLHKMFPRGEYQSISEWRDGSLVEVDGVGTGFMLLKTEIFSKIAEPWFWNMPIRAREHWVVLGEDYTFCRNAKDAGYKIHLDTAVKCGHDGIHTFTTEDFLACKEAKVEVPVIVDEGKVEIVH